ncbi:hypothetical protein ACFFLM_25845 [Deinococcus oregonensis]|uniref:Uncharacterized protein n=1 Tax=Deinococcus oregonensis TaxID=1805970 RepID=A0ABV6B6H2_9DEIO
MALDYAELHQQAEQWKAEGKTPDESAALAASRGASTMEVIALLRQVFDLFPAQAKSSGVGAVHGDKYRGKP